MAEIIQITDEIRVNRIAIVAKTIADSLAGAETLKQPGFSPSKLPLITGLPMRTVVRMEFTPDSMDLVNEKLLLPAVGIGLVNGLTVVPAGMGDYHLHNSLAAGRLNEGTKDELEVKTASLNGNTHFRSVASVLEGTTILVDQLVAGRDGNVRSDPPGVVIYVARRIISGLMAHDGLSSEDYDGLLHMGIYKIIGPENPDPKQLEFFLRDMAVLGNRIRKNPLELEIARVEAATLDEYARRNMKDLISL